MENKNNDYNFSFIRIIFCLAVLFYHLGLLKGGYLAVCSLFVLAGYFTTISLSKKKTLIPYYKKRLIRIYQSLIVVVFMTVAFISIFDINLLNLKPEVKSILLSYNNYWQLDVNSDYFTKNINSPFIHLWYMSILLQIQIVFSLIYFVIKKIGDKVHKSIPCIILFFFAIISTIYFYHVSITKDIMFTYYDTFSRLFSFMIGAFLGTFHIYYNRLFMAPRSKILKIIAYIFYLIIIVLLFIFINSSSKYIALSMILITIITTRLIEYGIILYKDGKKIINGIIQFISDISYEIYLVQYPVLFFFNYIKINSVLKNILIIIITIIISWLIHYSMKIEKKKKVSIIKKLVQIIILLLTLYGTYQYAIAKDHTKEMNILKESLKEKEKLIKEKQLEYRKKQEQAKEEWESYVNSLEVDENKLYEYVTNLKVVGVGDSVMLDPINELYKEFPNGYFDAKISRSTCAAYDVLKNIKNSKITWDILVFNLGTNGYPNDKCKNNLMSLSNDSKVFWLNTTHPDYDSNNSELERYASEKDNIIILDWESYIKENPGLLYSDYTHLRPSGFKPYAKFIKDEIYKYFLNERNKEKEKAIEDAINNKKETVTFYGNDLLLNVFDDLQKTYPESKFEATKDMDINKLKNIINKEIKEENLNDKLIFIFDKQSKLAKKDYQKIIKLCNNNKIYIISLDNIDIKNDNVEVLNLNLTENDYMNDEIHLNSEGNKKLLSTISKVINN